MKNSNEIVFRCWGNLKLFILGNSTFLDLIYDVIQIVHIFAIKIQILVSIPIDFLYAFSIVVTTVNAIALWILQNINWKYKRNRISHHLSRKFQIEENIRVLKLFKPQMFLEFFFGYTAAGACIFTDKYFHNTPAANILYFTVSTHIFYVVLPETVFLWLFSKEWWKLQLIEKQWHYLWNFCRLNFRFHFHFLGNLIFSHIPACSFKITTLPTWRSFPEFIIRRLFN